MIHFITKTTPIAYRIRGNFRGTYFLRISLLGLQLRTFSPQKFPLEGYMKWNNLYYTFHLSFKGRPSVKI